MDIECGGTVVLNKMSIKRLNIVKLIRSVVRSSMVIFFCQGPVVASDQLQSLLFLIDDAGLTLERQVPPPVTQNNDSSGRIATDRQALLLAAIRRGSGINQTAISDVFSNLPSARWYSQTGDLLTVTRFVDPRVLRAPQQGDRIHEAIVAKTSARFLIRGPLNAVSVEIFLPELSNSVEIRPMLTATTPATARTAGQIESTLQADTANQNPPSMADSAATSLTEQSWRIDL